LQGIKIGFLLWHFPFNFYKGWVTHAAVHMGQMPHMWCHSPHLLGCQDWFPAVATAGHLFLFIYYFFIYYYFIIVHTFISNATKRIDLLPVNELERVVYVQV
jgi:hypothetical protein